MRRTALARYLLATALLAGILAAGPVADARATAAGPASINVWVENAGVVHRSFDDVRIAVRAARGCFATVVVIDTDGYLHVVHPLSRRDNAWLNRGVTYRFTGRDLGLGVLDGRGVAHVFAIGSPHPLDYSPYGDAIFVGGFGYRVFGDPYFVWDEFCAALLPGVYAADFIGVSFARFYVREWKRYPVYLCHGRHGATVHVRTGGYCRRCAGVYEAYRLHVNDPGAAVRAARGRSGARLERTDSHEYKGIRRVDPVRRDRTEVRRVTVVGDGGNNGKIVSARRTTTVVRASGAKRRPATDRVNAERATRTKTHYKTRVREGQVNK